MALIMGAVRVANAPADQQSRACREAAGRAARLPQPAPVEVVPHQVPCAHK